jgi:hypothetical protein
LCLTEQVKINRRKNTSLGLSVPLEHDMGHH